MAEKAERNKEIAAYLLDLVPDNQWENVIAYLEGIITRPRGEDPFYSEENLAHLKKVIDDIESGRAILKEHDLIEVA